jgi:hypothetical protein
MKKCKLQKSIFFDFFQKSIFSIFLLRRYATAKVQAQMGFGLSHTMGAMSATNPLTATYKTPSFRSSRYDQIWHRGQKWQFFTHFLAPQQAPRFQFMGYEGQHPGTTYTQSQRTRSPARSRRIDERDEKNQKKKKKTSKKRAFLLLQITMLQITIPNNF